MSLRKSDKYNTPYDRDMAYKEYNRSLRQANKSSGTTKLLLLIAWFILIVIFV